jgi:uncharacterized protein (TIGR00369 family)
MDLETVRGFFAKSPFMVDLGVMPMAVAPGKISTQLTLATRHQQHTGVVHAGVMAAMADHTMGAAAQTLAPAGHWVLTAELKTSLLRAGKGQRLVCEAVVIKAGRSLSFTEAEVWAETDIADSQDGPERVLVMKASATMAVTKAS